MDILAALFVGWLLSSAVDGDLEISTLHDPGNAYCHRSDWTGNVRITKPLAEHPRGEVGAVLDHRSCLLEENDRSTSDVMGFYWRWERR